MELWIRSQDKLKLFNNCNLYINTTFVDEFAIEDLNNESIKLGTYKTKERALEVLDEIQNIFSLKIENKSYEEADLVLKAKMLDSYYQMPED